MAADLIIYIWYAVGVLFLFAIGSVFTEWRWNWPLLFIFCPGLACWLILTLEVAGYIDWMMI